MKIWMDIYSEADAREAFKRLIRARKLDMVLDLGESAGAEIPRKKFSEEEEKNFLKKHQIDKNGI